MGSADGEGLSELRVASYTDVIGPRVEMLGPIANGGMLVVHTVNGCWGPMITPSMRGGHEVTLPVAVAGARVGDAVVLSVRKITIRSRAAASGTHDVVAGRNAGDPGAAALCPRCGRTNPPSYLKGIGFQAVRCQACDAEVIPFTAPNGYTMVFDRAREIGVTVDRRTAEQIAERHEEYSGLWDGSRQHSALVMAVADLPGILTRIRPMIGNIGTSPGVMMPSSSNAGDLGQRLVGAVHDLGIERSQLELRTDGHMDIDSVGEGTVIICPVKIPGAGIYVGDVHAQQGDGEIAGHTTDVSAEVVLEVNLIKGLNLDGPVLLPRGEDLPPLAKPYTPAERSKGIDLANTLGVDLETDVAPVQVVGSGLDLTAAVNNGLDRLAALAGTSVDEVRNRVTITGGIEIGRLPGVVQVTALLPIARLDHLGMGSLYRRQYGLEY